MSTHYRLWCKDCKDECEAPRERNSTRALAALYRLRQPLIAAMQAVCSVDEPVLLTLRILGDGGRDYVDLTWLEKHTDHAVCIRNEYGELIEIPP